MGEPDDPVRRYRMVRAVTYDPNMLAPGPFTSTQVATPSSGGTVTSDGSNAMLINNAALLAALTVVFPAAPVNGQVFSVSARSSVTVLVMNATKSIYGGLTSFVAGGYARYIFSGAVDAWFRVG